MYGTKNERKKEFIVIKACFHKISHSTNINFQNHYIHMSKTSKIQRQFLKFSIYECNDFENGCS